ncbi:MarR family transcriptional regulator [Bacillus sp. RG28]|uniref:MarR family transcriptional regulator n=1 Tax=Gottfriedia endophytica TaxID=2820819 RepID=A0A940NRW6_9BACI|nr:MarR family transcriptional regulator [Gottfriedia endophytica]MBP0726675.1 MarR family transcriptional regulator [Gottfriedia endophytica]
MNYENQDLKQAGEVVQSFLAINKALIQFTQQNAAGFGLTMQQMSILNLIYSKPGMTFKSITEKLMMPKSTVSMSIDGLVELGLIERKQSTEDRREVNLTITLKGKEIAQKSIENASSYRAIAAVLENFSVDEIELLKRIHHNLLVSLEQIAKNI